MENWHETARVARDNMTEYRYRSLRLSFLGSQLLTNLGYKVSSNKQSEATQKVQVSSHL